MQLFWSYVQYPDAPGEARSGTVRILTSDYLRILCLVFSGIWRGFSKDSTLGGPSTHREYEKVVGVAVHSFFKDNVEELTHRRADAACRIRSKYMVCSFSKSELFDAGS